MKMFDSIRSQLLLIAFTPLILTVALISLFFVTDSLDAIEKEQERRGQDIVSQALLMTEFYFYTGNVAELDRISRQLIEIDGVSYVRFIDAQSIPLVVKGKYPSDAEVRTYSTQAVSHGINLDNFQGETGEKRKPVILGTIEIGLTQDYLLKQRSFSFIRGLLLAFLASLVGWGLVQVFISKFNRAMRSLLVAAQNLEKGNFENRCDENGTGELLSLQKNFNHMLTTLQRHQDSLKLEIELATSSLSSTVEELSLRNDELERTKQSAISIERSKAILEERARIMRDMHDGVGGQLVAAISMMEQEPDSASRRRIINALAECLDDFRLIINSLDVHSGSVIELLADFKYRIHRKLENINVALDWNMLNISDSITLAPQKSLHLLRILQEVFTNIIKHAGASEVRFTANVVMGHIIFNIEDNGSIDRSQIGKPGHGIRNMHSRTKEIGGDLIIEQSASGGCKVLLTIPL